MERVRRSSEVVLRLQRICWGSVTCLLGGDPALLTPMACPSVPTSCAARKQSKPAPELRLSAVATTTSEDENEACLLSSPFQQILARNGCGRCGERPHARNGRSRATRRAAAASGAGRHVHTCPTGRDTRRSSYRPGGLRKGEAASVVPRPRKHRRDEARSGGRGTSSGRGLSGTPYLGPTSRYSPTDCDSSSTMTSTPSGDTSSGIPSTVN